MVCFVQCFEFLAFFGDISVHIGITCASDSVLLSFRLHIEELVNRLENC